MSLGFLTESAILPSKSKPIQVDSRSQLRKFITSDDDDDDVVLVVVIMMMMMMMMMMRVMMVMMMMMRM